MGCVGFLREISIHRRMFADKEGVRELFNSLEMLLVM